MSDYDEIYEGPVETPPVVLDEIIEETGDASVEELSDLLLSGDGEVDEPEAEDMDGATEVFEGDGL